MRPAIEAVLFDYHGTVMQVETGEDWLRGGLRTAGIDLPEADFDRLLPTLIAAGRAGGPAPVRIPAELARAFAERDLTMEQHRTAYTSLLSTVDGVPAELATALYERLLDPATWTPYPDAAPVLTELRRRVIRTALVSNIGFDLRPMLAAADLAELFDEVVLSYEVGADKPNPKIFRLACDRLGVEPERALMVGDHPADGGAVSVGCRALLLPASPVGEVHGLDAVLALT
ncbi:HAD-IA family hydrolase [Fodinicola feengrottensis]|uniref:HAD-IA family hydrolase n=1 Tax=Fodinicola feengrottensis TaxID=435914 RepID=UPI0031CED684